MNSAPNKAATADNIDVTKAGPPGLFKQGDWPCKSCVCCRTISVAAHLLCYPVLKGVVTSITSGAMLVMFAIRFDLKNKKLAPDEGVVLMSARSAKPLEKHMIATGVTNTTTLAV